MNVQVKHIRPGICQGYEKRTANKGRFVISDFEIRRAEKLRKIKELQDADNSKSNY